MDYLDTKKQRYHTILLFSGYICIGIAILIATVILVYQAKGFGLAKNGTVIQNGIVFFSSQPNPAKIYINNKQLSDQTNARTLLPASIYKVKIARTGYQPWRRTIEVDGGSVTHYDYPLLLPLSPKTTKVADFDSPPTLTTQSPDHRWLVTANAASVDSFQLFDLKNPTKGAQLLTLPASLVTAATASEQWQFVEWSDDNQHVLLQHVVDGKTEFVLLDRQDPQASINISQLLNSPASTITLSNKKSDHYYLYDNATHVLQTASRNQTTPTTVLNDVLAYKTYGDKTVLFVTAADAPTGKVLLKLQTGDQTTILRSFAASSHYLVDMTTYDGTPYVIASASDENKVYVYRDPVAQIAAQSTQAIVPVQVMRLTQPNYESFSTNAQYIMAENGGQIAVYDLLNKQGYTYKLSTPLDAPQLHVTWMDGNRLVYIGNGKLQIQDYDHMNQRALVASTPTSLPFFTADYRTLYTVAPNDNAVVLNSTSLLTSSK